MTLILPNYTKAMLPEIDRQLRNYVDRPELAKYPGLGDMLSYHMGWEGEQAGTDSRGKRIRPLLVLVTADALGGNWKDALPAASAVELIHNFSLIHDDIEDRSVMRRGRRTLWDRWGQALAINAGDALFTLAYQTLEGLDDTNHQGIMVGSFKIINRTCLKLTGGQHLDITYEKERGLPIDSYWNMIAGKTAALLSACTGLGGLVGGADSRQLQAIQDFGYYLGMAFQVQDDWLGIWGDAALTGKSNASDLVDGKKTLPILSALQKGGEFAERWLAGNIGVDDVPDLTHMLEEAGARSFTEEQVSELTARALESLETAGCREPGNSTLKELAISLINRQN